MITDLRVEGVDIQHNDDFFNFVNNLPAGFYRTSTEGKIVFSNNNLALMLGFVSREEMSENNGGLNGFPNFLGNKKVSEKLEKYGEASGIESSVMRHDGTAVKIRENIRSVRDNDGKIKFYDVVVVDVSDRHQETDNYRKLLQIVEQSPVSIIVTDYEGRIEYVNPKTCQTTGYSFRELYGSNPVILKSGETEQGEYKLLWKTITSGKVWRGLFHNKKKNGELYWESATIAPVFNNAGVITHFIAVKEDITEKRGYEESLVKSENKYRMIAEELGRINATRDKLFSVIAHDLRGPIGNFIHVLDIFTETGDSDINLRKSIMQELRKESALIYEILENLLYWSKIQQNTIVVNPVVSDLKEVIAEVLRNYSTRAADKQLLLTVSISNDLKIYADREQLSLVFKNLLSNAIKFTPGGGNVNVIAGISNNNINVVFEDSGVGMGEETLKNIFSQNDFFRTYGTAGEKGRGLGLIICRYFAELNKGMIQIESEAGKGSRLTVSFPLI
jgi:PAS domain S-box-containing protein